MKKFWLVLSLAMFCLIVGSLWEFSLNDWSADKKLFLFQERLKFEEKRLDEQLRKLDHEGEWKKPEWKGKQSVLVGFKGSKLVYWSNERVGAPRLYEILSAGSDFVKINNLYFDVRKHAVGDTVYYALLFIKGDYSGNVGKRRTARVQPGREAVVQDRESGGAWGCCTHLFSVDSLHHVPSPAVLCLRNILGPGPVVPDAIIPRVRFLFSHCVVAFLDG